MSLDNLHTVVQMDHSPKSRVLFDQHGLSANKRICNFILYISWWADNVWQTFEFNSDEVWVYSEIRLFFVSFKHVGRIKNSDFGQKWRIC